MRISARSCFSASRASILCLLVSTAPSAFSAFAPPLAGRGLRPLSGPGVFSCTLRPPAARASGMLMGVELEASAETTVKAPMERVWGAWSNFEEMPKWMPWINAVEVQGGGVSKWTMRYETLGVPLRYSWTAQELPSIKHELIHWETTSGLDNKGRVEFSKVAGASGEEEIGVKMTIVYKLPRLVAMLTRDKSDGEEGAVRKTVQRIIQSDLLRFKRAMERQDGTEQEDDPPGESD